LERKKNKAEWKELFVDAVSFKQQKATKKEFVRLL
jgi:hypothetical protein